MPMSLMPSNLPTKPNAKVFAHCAILVAIASGLPGCRGEAASPSAGTQQNREPAVVRVAPVIVQAVDRGIDVTGTLYPDDITQISAQSPGRVIDVLKDLGDLVQPGELLAQVDRTEYELVLQQRQASVREALTRLGIDELPDEDFDLTILPAVQRAVAQQNNAEARFERGRLLYESETPLISQQEFADLETTLEVAQHNVTAEMLMGLNLLAQARSRATEVLIAEQQLRDTEIRAPVRAESRSGYVVADRLIAVGETVARGQSTFTLVDADPIKFRAEAPERYASVIKNGQTVTVRLDAFDVAFVGTVTRLSPRVDPQSRTFTFEAEIANPEGLLKPGSFAIGRVSTTIEQGVTFVPTSAVVSFAGVKRVFSVQGGKAVEHRVETGETIDDLIEITRGGPPAQSMVVITGGARLTNGADVTVTTEDAAGQQAVMLPASP